MDPSTSSDAPARPQTGDLRLRATIAAFPGKPFVVIDGAQIDDLPTRFERKRLFARCLFLDTGDTAAQRVGPWLVSLEQAPQATDEILELVGDLPAAVFWSCSAGEAVLHRHLRTLNMARIPGWAANQEAGPSGAGDASTAVFFRHYDPRVLGAVLPTLDAAQLVRVLGPSGEIAFLAVDYGGLRRVVANKDWPSAPPGMLTLRSEQIEALNARRATASRQRIADYLRDVAPGETSQLTDKQVFALVAESDRTGRQLGLKSEQAHARWAYVMVRTNGRALQQPGLREYITDGRVAPDEKMTWLLKTMAAMEARMAGEP